MFKNIGKNVKEVAIGAAGGVGSLVVGHMLLPKIPFIGKHVEDKPMIGHAVNGLIGIALMDVNENLGFGWAVVQATKAVGSIPMVQKWTGHHEHESVPVHDVINALTSEVKSTLSDLKSEEHAEKMHLS